MIKKVKNTVSWTYVNSDLDGEKILGTTYKRELLKIIQKEFRGEKMIELKGNKLMLNGKTTIVFQYLD